MVLQPGTQPLCCENLLIVIPQLVKKSGSSVTISECTVLVGTMGICPIHGRFYDQIEFSLYCEIDTFQIPTK